VCAAGVGDTTAITTKLTTTTTTVLLLSLLLLPIVGPSEASPIQEALVIVDKMYSEVPDLMKDAYWDLKRVHLPVTEATAAFKKVHFAGSTAYYQSVHDIKQIIRLPSPY